MTCPTTSSLGTSKPSQISRVMLLPMVLLANWIKKSEGTRQQVPKAHLPLDCLYRRTRRS